MTYAILRLVRLPNLLIVALTQYLIYGWLLRPAFAGHGIPVTLSSEQFWLLALSTVLASAGGYIINDLVDVRADAENRPTRQLIGRHIPRRTAWWLYFSLNLAGFLVALYLALALGKLHLLWLFPAAAVLLLGYSTHLKRLPLLGNLLIALFCAAVAGLVWLAEWGGFAELREQAPSAAAQVAAILLWYLAFAFLSTLYRELVKDMEDIKGDAVMGCRTLPIVLGMGGAKWVTGAAGLGLFTLLALMPLQQGSGFEAAHWAFWAVGLLLPLALSLYALFRAQDKAAFHRLSQVAKLVMLSGLLFLLLLVLY